MKSMSLIEDDAPVKKKWKDEEREDEGQEQGVMEIESLCMNCEQNGMTKLLCTRIPYYKQVILISFSCPHCGWHNNELQSGESVQEHGTRIVLSLRIGDDLNRQLVKSEYASITIPELDLEIPAKSQPGEVTTIEGVLLRVKLALDQDQSRRRLSDPENAEKIEAFMERIGQLLNGSRPFTLILDDPSGNCFIQNPQPFHVDPQCIVTHYQRTLADQKLLGLAADSEEEPEPLPEWQSFEDAKNEVVHFDTHCPECGADCETRMKPTDIPGFSTVIIMATCCDVCGYKTNEVKCGGAINDRGCRLSLRIEKIEDLNRDVLKSDSCGVAIPELEFEGGSGTLCGRFTTVEGFLTATRDMIREQSQFFLGDSAQSEEKVAMARLLNNFDEILALRLPVTLILDDPAGNSYIEALTDDDQRLEKDFYERNWDQKEELGLNDMKTDNYQQMNPVIEEEEEAAEMEES